MRRTSFVVLALFITLPAIAQESITPDQLWSAMLQGNQQFVAGKIVYDNLKAERELLKDGQLPPITVLACSDSRVPPELVFNQSLGGLFVIRTAGNVADDFGLASVEFGLSRGWTKLIVILAHEDCGAVTASLGGADPSTPSLNALAKRIRSSFVGIPYDSVDKANVRKATEANARASAAQLLAGSIMVRDAALTDRIKIVTAYYELVSGEVKKVD
ncbi:MAG: carbonic anhydrase [Thermoanaerobaculia bacterium]